MKRFKDMMNYLSSFFAGNIYFKLLSLFISIIVWFIVVWSIDPDVTTLVKNVPVQFGTSESSAIKRLGLNIIDGNNILATVYIKGNRNIVGVIEPEDISVVASVNEITEAGTYELEVKAEVKNQVYKDIKFTAIKPSVVKVKIDKVVTKTIPIEIVCNGVTVEEGYITEKPISSVDFVTITGPEKDVEKVDSALVVCDVHKKLNKTLKTVEDVVLSSKTLPAIETKYINLDSEIVSVTIPVLKKKTLPLVLDFTNLPPGFPIEELRYDISPSEIEVAGPEEEINQRESINLAYFDIKNLDLDSKIEYSINLPSNFINIENIEKAEVKFDFKNFDSKTFSNVLIKVPYSFRDYNIIVNSKRINNIKLVGSKNVLANIVSGDIVAEIELSDAEIAVGQKTVPLKISVPGKGLVWASGEYSSVITVTNKK